MMKPRPAPRRSYALAELVIILAIIAVLIALLLPAVQAARRARRAQCTNNFKQLVLAIHNYESANDHFPTSTFLKPPILGGSGWSTVVRNRVRLE